MNTIERVKNLAEERGLTLWKLALLCEVSHSTIANADKICVFRNSILRETDHLKVAFVQKFPGA